MSSSKMSGPLTANKRRILAITPVNNSYPAKLLLGSMNLNIYMHSWIVQDGNYADFCEGETRQFALEFWAPGLLTSSHTQKKSIAADDRYMYQVNAEVAFSCAEILVIDFGLLAYSEASTDLQCGFKTGDSKYLRPHSTRC